jgi:hypothetical protein
VIIGLNTLQCVSQTHKHILNSLHHRSFHFATTDLRKTTLNLMPDVDIVTISALNLKLVYV